MVASACNSAFVKMWHLGLDGRKLKLRQPGSGPHTPAQSAGEVASNHFPIRKLTSPFPTTEASKPTAVGEHLVLVAASAVVAPAAVLVIVSLFGHFTGDAM